MTSYIKLAVQNHITICENFLSNVRIAALKDDGVADKSEKAQIKKIDKLTQDYIKKLQNLAK